MSMVCGIMTIYEEAYCYTEGSKCEQLYKEGKSLRNADKYTQSNEAFNAIFEGKKEKYSDISYDRSQVKSNQCGVQKSPKQRNWGLRIIGKSFFYVQKVAKKGIYSCVPNHVILNHL